MKNTSAGLIRHGRYPALLTNYLATHVPDLSPLPSGSTSAKNGRTPLPRRDDRKVMAMNRRRRSLCPSSLPGSSIHCHDHDCSKNRRDTDRPSLPGHCPFASGARIPPACFRHVFFQPLSQAASLCRLTCRPILLVKVCCVRSGAMRGLKVFDEPDPSCHDGERC
jgi:hypothetical protein